MSRFFNSLLSLAAIAAIILGVVYVTTLPGTQDKGGGKRFKGAGGEAVPVLATAARIADVPVYLNGVGTAKARNLVTVRPQVDGRIVSIDFKEGQEIKRGDVLARIDPATYQAQLDQALAKKALDDAQLDNARRDLDRYSILQGGVVAQKTIDTQRALVAQLTAQVKQDEAAIANARAVLDYTTIVSPIDGRTGMRLVDEGNLVRASDAGIVVITEVRPIAVIFTLPQQQLAQVNKAMAEGTVSVEALDADGRTAIDRGVLQVVDNQVDSTTGTIRMKAEFPNADLKLWPGQFVNVRLLLDTLEQVVVAPTQSVQRGPHGTFTFVVGAENTVALRPVTVGMQNEIDTVITKGLAAGDRVVTTGFARLKDGSSVTVSAPEEPQGKSAPAVKKQEGPPEARTTTVRTACAADLQKFCPNAERRELGTCLRNNAEKLSEMCKVASAAMKGRAKDGSANTP